jgi:hypothetical protein
MPPSDQVEWVNGGQQWTCPGPHRGLPACQRRLPGAKWATFSPAPAPVGPDAVGPAPLPRMGLQHGDRSRAHDLLQGTISVRGARPLAYACAVALPMAPKTPHDIGAVRRDMILMKAVETMSGQVHRH